MENKKDLKAETMAALEEALVEVRADPTYQAWNEKLSLREHSRHVAAEKADAITYHAGDAITALGTALSRLEPANRVRALKRIGYCLACGLERRECATRCGGEKAAANVVAYELAVAAPEKKPRKAPAKKAAVRRRPK